jgi:hypothetical protein
MGDTFIPGNDLDQLTQVLPQIKQLVSSANDAAQTYAPSSGSVSHTRGDSGLGDSQGDIFGDQKVSQAVRNFQSKWSDGDYQLGKEIDNLTGMAKNIQNSFQQTDQDLLDVLEGKTPPDQSGRHADSSLNLGAPQPRGGADAGGRTQPKVG